MLLRAFYAIRLERILTERLEKTGLMRHSARVLSLLSGPIPKAPSFVGGYLLSCGATQLWRSSPPNRGCRKATDIRTDREILAQELVG